MLKTARQHNVSPFLYHHLKQFNVPKKILKDVHQDFEITMMNNMLFQSELRRVLKAFNKKKVPLLLLKGAALIQTIYSNFGLRPMCDLDLMVEKENLNVAHDLLLQLGYYYADIARRKGIAGKLLQLRYGSEKESVEKLLRHHQYVTFRGRTPISFELHWHPWAQRKSLTFDEKSLWAKTVQTKIAGAKAKTLQPELNLIQLCLHLILNRVLTYPLKHIMDLREVINSTSLDWKKIINFAKEFKVEDKIFFALKLSKDLINADVPEEVLASLKPGRVSVTLYQLIIKNYFLVNKTPEFVTEILGILAKQSPFNTPV